MASRRATFAICFGVIFTDMVSYGVISPSIPLFARALTASDAEMGLAFAGYPIAFTLAVLPLGLFVDRVGKNWLIATAAMVLLAGACVLMAYAWSVAVLVLARALQGLASAAAWVATQPLVAGRDGAAEPDSREMSVVTVAAGVGVIVGPLVGSVGELQTPFLINGALALVCGIAAGLFLTREGPRPSPGGFPLGALLRRRGIAVACLAIFCSCACFGVLELLLPLRLDRVGYDKQWIGLAFGVFSVAYVAAQPLISRWIDRRGGLEPIGAGSVGLASVMAVVVHATGFPVLAAMMVLAGAFSGALFLASMFVVGQHSAAGQRGQAYALWNLAFSLGYLVGPTAGGQLSSTVGLTSAFYAFAALLVIGAAAVHLAAPAASARAERA